MPNWCECTLTLHGPDRAIDDFIEKNRTPERLLSFSAALPPPEWLDDQLGTASCAVCVLWEDRRLASAMVHD